MKKSFPTRASAALCGLAAAILLACQAKEKPSRFMTGASVNPPWDAPGFAPKALVPDSAAASAGAAAPAADSVFGIFTAIARLDSAAGDRKDWKRDAKAVDTIQLGQMFDTGFVFPAKAEAAVPYAFDDSFRDDTLYRSFWGNGLFTEDHPCAPAFVVSGEFLHPARWMKAGLTQADVVGALGRPAYWQGDTADGVLRYASRQLKSLPSLLSGGPNDDDEPDTSAANTFYEGADFYFLKDSLFAAVLRRSQPCH